MRKFLSWSLIACITLILSCSKSGEDSNALYKSGDVFMAGHLLGSNSNTAAVYWKNQELQRLSTGSTNSFAYDVAVSGNDVYVVGDSSLGPAAGNGTVAVYWKNGQKTVLTSTNSTASAIFISGNDVYISGFMNSATGKINAVYWKNGVVNILGESSKTSRAEDILVSGTDVYVAGLAEVNSILTAAYWKNNTLVSLPPVPTVLSHARSIFVSGTDIYVGGSLANPAAAGSSPVIWKNGVASFPDNNNPGAVYAIGVSGNNVYAAGQGSIKASPGLWKNGSAVNIPSNYTTALTAYGMAFSGSDVYLAGEGTGSGFNRPAVFWKNNTEFKLADAGRIYGIYIVQ